VWWTKFKAFATAKGFDKALLERETSLPATQREVIDVTTDAGKAAAAAKQRNSLAMAYLLNALKTQADISMAYDAMDADWPGGLAHKVVKNLEAVYRPKDTVTEVEVYTKLLGVKMKENENPKTLFEQIAAIQNWYNTGSKVLPKEQLIAVVLKAAPKKYMSVLTSEQAAKGSNLTLTDLRAVMNQYYRAMNQGKKNENKEEEEELQMAEADENKGPKCYNCHKHGHIARNCPEKKNKCSGCGKYGHDYEDCWDNPRNEYKVPKWYKMRAEWFSKKDEKNEVQAIEQEWQTSHELQMVHAEKFEIDEKCEGDTLDYKGAEGPMFMKPKRNANKKEQLIMKTGGDELIPVKQDESNVWSEISVDDG